MVCWIANNTRLFRVNCFPTDRVIIPTLESGILLSPPSVCPSVRSSVHPSVRYAISSQTAGQNPTKFGEWLAYTSGACKSMFIFGPALRGPGEGSKGQILTSVGICDGVPSTARSSLKLKYMQSYTLTNLLVKIRNNQAKDGQESTFYMTTPYGTP